MSEFYAVTTGKLKDTGEQVAFTQIKYDPQAVSAKAELEQIVAAAKQRHWADKAGGGSKIFPGLRGYEEGEV